MVLIQLLGTTSTSHSGVSPATRSVVEVALNSLLTLIDDSVFVPANTRNVVTIIIHYYI